MRLHRAPDISYAEIEAMEQAEGERWAAAAKDPDFQRDVREISEDLRYADSWPE